MIIIGEPRTCEPLNPEPINGFFSIELFARDPAIYYGR